MNAFRFAFLCFALASNEAFARDIFVDNTTGDDRFRGHSGRILPGLQGPVRSLQKAVNLARPGDRIVVVSTGVPFQEEVVINGVGRENPNDANPIVIEGNGEMLDGLVAIDHRYARPLGGGLFQFETPLGPTHWSDILFVDGAPAPRGRDRWPTGKPRLSAGHFANWNGWLCFQTAPTEYVDRHAFAMSRLNVGMTIYRSNNWIVRNLVFRGYRLDGVRLHGPVQNVEFQYCRFLHNGRCGIAAHGSTHGVVVDSTALGNGRAGAVGRNWSRLHLLRVNVEGSPRLFDADPSASVSTTPGAPQAAPKIDPGTPSRTLDER